MKTNDEYIIDNQTLRGLVLGRLSPLRRTLRHALYILTILALLLNVISFVTPNWYQSWTIINDTTFKKIGLWEVCLQGFRHPGKYHWGKVNSGCWWIFAHEFKNIRENNIINPPWFKCVQVMCTIAFISILIAFIFTIILIVKNDLKLSEKKLRKSRYNYSITFLLRALFVTHLICTITLFIAILVFGIRANDYDWLKVSTYFYYSWSYGCAIVSMLFSLFATILAFIEGQSSNLIHIPMDNETIVKSIPSHQEYFIDDASTFRNV
ncbi:hypothetical protein SNEBB_000561 [Seison nebaliae]|nr:hypothetical protein SNEBB_000561 [Seison nebaliae]